MPLLIKRAKELKIGDGMNDAIEMGPIVTDIARQRITGYIEKGVAEGAKPVAGRPQLCRKRAREAASSSAPRCSTM